MITTRSRFGAAVLDDGRVLVMGGYPTSTSTALASAETWDPATGTWTSTGAMTVGRDGPSAIRVAGGKVLVSGGYNTNARLASAELYDLATRTFAATGSMATARMKAASTALLDGAVLVTGGTPFSTAIEQYDAATGTWRDAGRFDQARDAHSASRLADGKVLVAGGSGPLASAVVYDPACANPALSPAGASFDSSGGGATIEVAQPAGCAWNVTGVPSWISVTAGTPGNGGGSVSYAVAANAGAARSATLVVAGRGFVVSQAANPCATPATLSPSSASFASAGGTGSVAVTYAAGCSWSASGTPAWITITSGASGAGSGTVNYSVAANTSIARSATLSIAGSAFTVSQAAAAAGGCDFVGTAAPGGTYSGTLSTTDCTGGARGTSYYTDRYSFTASGGQQVAFLLTSGAFDTYLYLRNPSGTVVASNDDGGGGTNSRIPATSGVFTLPAGASGTYVIEVTSYATRATGAYTLQRLQ